MNKIIQKTPVTIAVLLATVALVIVFVVLVRPRFSEAASKGPLMGWVWSDTVGWVSLNCSNDNTCGISNYALSIDGSGDISGYAWSEYVGWISANISDLTGCPTSPCTAKMKGNTITGWLKVLSANGSQSGGWDGFIKLSDTGYGPTLKKAVFSGFSWGDTVVGWLDWSAANTTYVPCASQNICSGNNVVDSCTGAVVQACTGGTICSAGACILPPPPAVVPFGSFSGHLTARPSLVRPRDTTKLYWNIANVATSTCSVTGNGDSWVGLAFSGSTGQVTRPIISQNTYTLMCTGLDNSMFTEKTKVNIIPIFQEQ